jgi:hypothetical protein
VGGIRLDICIFRIMNIFRICGSLCLFLWYNKVCYFFQSWLDLSYLFDLFWCHRDHRDWFIIAAIAAITAIIMLLLFLFLFLLSLFRSAHLLLPSFFMPLLPWNWLCLKPLCLLLELIFPLNLVFLFDLVDDLKNFFEGIFGVPWIKCLWIFLPNLILIHEHS